jgi:polyisoprenoid-binding protein YceI
MKKAMIIFSVVVALFSPAAHAQGKFYTKTGKISFFSSTSLENIEANNKSVTVLLDSKTGDLQFAVLMKGFEFKKALMQEHFNSEYIESDKFPKGEFKGQVTNNGDISYSVNGSYPAKVKGRLTIHGETKDIETSGTITVTDGKITLSSSFNVLVADYKITIPKLYRNNIAPSIKVTVDCALTPL